MKYHCSVLCLALTLWAVSCRTEKAGVFGPEGIEIPAAGEDSLNSAPLLLNMEQGPDFILASYRDPALLEWVTAFFRDLCGSREIAELILSNAAEFGVSPSLAFSLSWEESRYNTRAFNRNRNNTVDRGLFQLNSASFPNLEEEDFYDPGINTRYGIAHLRWCLDNAGTEVAALAMYNAGHHRIHSGGTPRSTLDYVSRILRRQHKIEELFLDEYIRFTEERLNAEKRGRPSFRLSLLTPLGRR